MAGMEEKGLCGSQTFVKCCLRPSHKVTLEGTNPLERRKLILVGEGKIIAISKAPVGYV